MSLFEPSNIQKPSRKDPELAEETRHVKTAYPFSLSTSNSKPLQSRFLVSLRTKKDFDDVTKYHPDNTPEAIIEKEKNSNPYKLKKELRVMTKGRYDGHDDVKKVN